MEHQRGATRRAQREIERLQAQLATLQAASTTVDEAKRVVDNVRVEFEAGCRMVEEGYRRMLVAVEREDLAVAARALHGNARRGLGAGISAIGDRMVDRINNTVVRISKVLDDLSGTGTVQTDAIRHDAGTPDNAEIAPDGAPSGIRMGGLSNTSCSLTERMHIRGMRNLWATEKERFWTGSQSPSVNYLALL